MLPGTSTTEKKHEETVQVKDDSSATTTTASSSLQGKSPIKQEKPEPEVLPEYRSTLDSVVDRGSPMEVSSLESSRSSKTAINGQATINKCATLSVSVQKRGADQQPTPDAAVATPKRQKLDQFSVEAVTEYVNNLKEKQLELFLDNIMELFFLEHHGNLMDIFSWRKKPPTEPLLQSLSVYAGQDQELADLLASKVLVDSSHLSAKAPNIPHSFSASVDTTQFTPLTVASSLSPSVLPGTPSLTGATSRSSHFSQSVAPALTETPDYGLAISAKTPLTVVPKAPRISLTSAKTACSALVSSSGAAAYSGRAHATRQHSISAVYDSSIGSQEQIVERAKQEAHVMQRIAELRKEGLWSLKRLPKVQEPPRTKAHWDYLLEEMSWLATDFAQERKWKKVAAKKCARMVMKYHQDKEAQKEREKREQVTRLKKIASTLAKEIRNFWSSLEKVLEFKHNTRLEEKRKKALDMHLNFIVGQTEQYSSWLAEGLTPSIECAAQEAQQMAGATTTDVSEVENEASDNDFEPSKHSESDDEETIAKEEADDSGSGGDSSELDLLQKESEIPIEDLLKNLPHEILDKPASLCGSRVSEDDVPSTSTGTKRKQEEEDDDRSNDFSIETEEEDDEETIEREEKEEGTNMDYSVELKELDDDANLTVEELLAKYQEAFAEGYEVPEPSEDETEVDEDETEEDELNDDITEEDEAADDESEPEEDIGMEFLIHPEDELKKPKIEVISEDGKPTESKPGHPTREITDIAAGAEQIQPKGNTLSTAKVVTKVPFLLKYTLREYQHIGLDWLVAMYEKKLNGILADEMGLGKTIQTIALLAHLACEKGIWGPHLIVVPTSVMLNWEMEIKKWCPAFKTMTYYGTPKERKLKRQGWTKPNQFHICITSYKLVIQDHQSFRRKKWRYLILDEAQHIKNFKSQRWQMLLNFNTSRRLLLTGTPLQNNLMELWSLMHFLMPNVFASHKDFKDWFVNPVTGMIEGNHEFNEALIRRLHKVLRPFLLRRLKSQVEQQMPKKYEHVVPCRLSKRQRYLYEDFMSLTKTKETLATGNFLSVINVLMQLRKVCNHPNLFETRPTVSPFSVERLTYETASLATTPLIYDPFKQVNLDTLNLSIVNASQNISAFAHHRIKTFQATPKLIEEIDSAPEPPPLVPRGKIRLQVRTTKTSQMSASQAQRQALAPGRTLVSTTSSNSSGTTPSAPSPRIILVSSGAKTNCTTTASSTVNAGVSEGSSMIKRPGTSIPASAGVETLNSQMLKAQLGKVLQTPNGQQLIIDSQSKETCRSLLATAQEKVAEKKASPFFLPDLTRKQQEDRTEKLRWLGRLNQQRCSALPLYSLDLVEIATVNAHPGQITTSSHGQSSFNVGQGYYHCRHSTSEECSKNYWFTTNALSEAILSPEQRMRAMRDTLNRFVTAVPPVSAPRIAMHVSHPVPSQKRGEALFENEIREAISPKCDLFHPYVSNIRTQFPELRLIQYDCGKLQTLDTLLWQLKSGGHRVLIFTQMSRMLDIFEQFLNYHGHTYLRLDGSTKIEQRQSLMERFNADKRIFCFILSTRSGGVGVNLTGADTVIFYDSDWNPTMDAQAQDRCHRIGQTRDVHIYRLISERTVEENILKKAQQKKLLGDIAIEEGNFTTAFFKQNAITDLFGDELKGAGEDLSSLMEQDAMVEEPLSSTDAVAASETPSPPGVEESTTLQAKWEEALEGVEENPDVAAAKTARAEAAAEFAEFDENIPLDQDVNNEDRSAAENELDKIMLELTPVERYALSFLESTQDPAQTEQLKLADEEIEAHKKDWELGRMQTLKTEASKASDDSDSEKDEILTMSREDAYNQMYISHHHMEQMPIWAPPTPPQDDNDLHVDYCLGFLYENSVMPESHLPPVYVQKESHKRQRLEPVATARTKPRIRKEELMTVPKSLFDRPTPVIVKLRKELKLQRARGNLIGGPDIAQLQKILATIGPTVQLPTPPTLVAQFQNSKSSQILLAGLQQENQAPWSINEEFSILQALQTIQELPANLLVLSPGHLPNWDLVSDLVSSMSANFRAPRVCRHHYETVVIPREEGKTVVSSEPPPKKKKVKGQPPAAQGAATPSVAPVSGTPTPASASNGATPSAGPPKGRPVKTSYLFKQDDHHQFSQLSNVRFETLKSISNKRIPSMKPIFVTGTNKNNATHIALLGDHGITYDTPKNPHVVAVNRQDRIQREKQKAQAEQLAKQKQAQLQLLQKQQQQAQQSQLKAQQLLASVQQQPQPAQFQAQLQARASQAGLAQQAQQVPGVIPRGPTMTSPIVSTTQYLNQLAKSSGPGTTFTVQASAPQQQLLQKQQQVQQSQMKAHQLLANVQQQPQPSQFQAQLQARALQAGLVQQSQVPGQYPRGPTPPIAASGAGLISVTMSSPVVSTSQYLNQLAKSTGSATFTVQASAPQQQHSNLQLTVPVSVGMGTVGTRVAVSSAGNLSTAQIISGAPGTSGAVYSVSNLPQQKWIITAVPVSQAMQARALQAGLVQQSQQLQGANLRGQTPPIATSRAGLISATMSNPIVSTKQDLNQLTKSSGPGATFTVQASAPQQQHSNLQLSVPVSVGMGTVGTRVAVSSAGTIISCAPGTSGAVYSVSNLPQQKLIIKAVPVGQTLQARALQAGLVQQTQQVSGGNLRGPTMNSPIVSTSHDLNQLPKPGPGATFAFQASATHQQLLLKQQQQAQQSQLKAQQLITNVQQQTQPSQFQAQLQARASQAGLVQLSQQVPGTIPRGPTMTSPIVSTSQELNQLANSPNPGATFTVQASAPQQQHSNLQLSVPVSAGMGAVGTRVAVSSAGTPSTTQIITGVAGTSGAVYNVSTVLPQQKLIIKAAHVDQPLNPVPRDTNK